MTNKRVYIKFAIKNKGLLIAIQNLIKKELYQYNAKLIKHEDLHLTVFHYGKPRNLFEDLSRENWGLKYEEFLSYFNKMITNSKDIVSLANNNFSTRVLGISSIRPMSRMLDMFGPGDYGVLVLRLNEPKELKQTRKLLMNEVIIFLDKCKIKDPISFMRNNEDLKWQVDYNPHVSIAIIDDPSIKLQEYNLSGFQILLSEIFFVN